MIFKKIVNTSFLIFFGIHVYAQINKEHNNHSILKSSLGVSITPFLFEKAHNYAAKDNYQTNFTSRLAGEVLISYYHNFSSNSSIVFSLGGGAISHNFHYEIPKEVFNSATGLNLSSKLTEAIPISTSYIKTQGEIQLKSVKNKKWLGAAGLALLYTFAGPSEYNAGIFIGPNSQNSIEYLGIDQNNNNNHTPWLNFHVSGGYEWMLGSRSLLQTSLKLNYSPVKFVTGIYQFNIGNLPEVTNRYSISGSYIGLCISYIFRK